MFNWAKATIRRSVNMTGIRPRTFIVIYAILVVSNGFLLVFGALIGHPVVVDVAKEAYTITLSAAIGALSTLVGSNT
jgi:hypothetical protein